MMRTAIVAADRLGEILNLEVEKKETQKLTPASLKGEISIQNVDFRYGTRQLVLEGISLNIKSGENYLL